MIVFQCLKNSISASLSTRHNLPHNYDIFENTQLKPLSLLNILGFFFLVIFLGKVTLLLFLNKLLRGWVF